MTLFNLSVQYLNTGMEIPSSDIDDQAQKAPHSKQLTLLKIAVYSTLAIIIVIFSFKISNLQRSLKDNALTIGGGKLQQAPELSREVIQLKSELKKLSQAVEEYQKQQIKPASSEVARFDDGKFSKQQTMINFLHMHSSQVYYYQKVDYLKSIKSPHLYDRAFISFMQALNNYKLPHPNAPLQRQINDYVNKEKQRLSKEHDFNLEELPFCIVVCTMNNAKNFRYQYNLQSMVNLDYKNFKIVIIDDASTDHTYELLQLFIEENNITNNIVLIKNEKRLSALPNFDTAIKKHCSPSDIIVLVDGDDEMLGKYSPKVFNDIYTKNKVDIEYSKLNIVFTQLFLSIQFNTD